MLTNKFEGLEGVEAALEFMNNKPNGIVEPFVLIAYAEK
jgi:hypothetical protein